MSQLDFVAQLTATETRTAMHSSASLEKLLTFVDDSDGATRALREKLGASIATGHHVGTMLLLRRRFPIDQNSLVQVLQFNRAPESDRMTSAALVMADGRSNDALQKTMLQLGPPVRAMATDWLAHVERTAKRAEDGQ